jgi:hexosaminidase
MPVNVPGSSPSTRRFTLPLIPQPASVEWKIAPENSSFQVRNGTPLIADERSSGTAYWFAKQLADSRGIHLDVRVHSAGSAYPVLPDAIELTLEPEFLGRDHLEREGYTLSVDMHDAGVLAADEAGLFYGAVSLLQLMNDDSRRAQSIDVPLVHILDKPRFAWRGAMLDSARHFQSVAFVKRFIDQLALLKLNTLHWHLTDDQGWRVEIKRYPKLTEVGAWRRDAGAAGTDADGKPIRYGGF